MTRGQPPLLCRATTLAGAALVGALGLLGADANGQGSAPRTVHGTITNGTVGGAARAERVVLIHLAEGMNEVAHLADVDGSFSFALEQPGPYLVQVHYQAVQYTERVAPAGGPVELAFTVFETTSDAAALQVSIPHYIIIVDGPKLHFSRVFEILNPTDPPRVVVGKPGAFRFDVPAAATVAKGSVQTRSMPLRMEPVDTFDDRGQTIAYPMKPGVTRYEIEHEMPYSGSAQIRETLYHGAVGVNVVVLPAEVTVTAPGLVAHGPTEREGVTFLTFTGQGLPAGQVLTIDVAGAAVAPRAPGSVEPSAQRSTGDGSPIPGAEGEIQAVENQTGRGWRKYAVVAGSSALLCLVLALALSRPETRGRSTAAAAPRSSQLAERLLDELVDLDRRREAGASDPEALDRSRADVKRSLVAELEEVRRKKTSA